MAESAPWVVEQQPLAADDDSSFVTGTASSSSRAEPSSRHSKPYVTEEQESLTAEELTIVEPPAADRGT